MSQAPLDPQGLVPRIAAGELKVMRQSTMGSGDICLYRMGKDLDPNRPSGTGEARIVGTAYHAGTEFFYEATRLDHFAYPLPDLQRAASHSFAEQSANFTDWETSRADSEARVLFMLERYFTDGCHWSPNEYEILGVEQEWFLQLSEGWVVKGTIDLVLRHRKTGKITLVDHKTCNRMWNQGKEHPRKAQQAVLYCWAWWSLTGEVPEAFYFDIMSYKGVFDRRLSQPTSEHMRAVLNKAIGLCRVVDSVPPELLPANPTSNLCSQKFCDHWFVCPFGAAGVS